MMDFLFNYLGANKYTAVSICLSSDYVLVNMFTILQVIIGLCAFVMAGILFVCYRNGHNMLRVSVVLLKDPWILKLVAFYILLIGLEKMIAVVTLHYAVFNLQILLQSFMMGVGTWTIFRLLLVTFDVTRQASLLDEVLTVGSGEIPDYGPQRDEIGVMQPLQTDLHMPVRKKDADGTAKDSTVTERE